MNEEGAAVAPHRAATPARVLLVHCYYREPGGEDSVFETEAALLADNGHPVETFVRRNGDLPAETMAGKFSVAAETVWAREAAASLAATITRFQPDVVHVHNTFQRLSPTVYRACASAGVPVVQTLHNYRYGCVAATLFRDGRPCEDCVGRAVPWPGVAHGCYRGSRPGSAVVATMTAVHRAAGSWRLVQRYIALTSFARGRFVAMGIPPEKITVKAQVITPDPGARDPATVGDYLLFAGRLTFDKGIRLLLQAAAACPDVPVVVAGDGPLREEAEQRAAALENVRLLGQVSRSEVSDLMKGSRAVVVPSLWYENFPMVIAEAYARAVPVLASAGGSLPDVVADGQTGWLFPLGDGAALATLLRRAWDAPEQLRTMGLAGRRRFEDQYAAGPGYRALQAIYSDVIAG